MAQKKEMDLPAAETLSCFQAANAKPAASTLPPTSGTARSAEHQMDGTVGRMEGAGVIPVDTKVTVAEALGAQSTSAANRCSGCQRKVGLTGFRCRCGDLFCGKHRYSDRHDCSFDYKTAGQTAISRENPLVRASKILRI